MNDKTEINQNAGLGSHGNTFIAEQYNGLSVADATHMALSMFREYYPQLREELLSDLRKMLEEKLKIYHQRILFRHPQELQYQLYKTQV